MKKFKTGDFLYINREITGFEYVFIFKDLIGKRLYCYCSSFLQNPEYDDDLNYFKYSLLCDLHEEDMICLATEDEIKHLVGQMSKHHLTWDKRLLELTDNEEL